jgi:predicted amidohydrolase YtcJ
MNFRLVSPFIFCVLVLLTRCSPKNNIAADLALINGRIWTGIDSASFAEAVAVKGTIISQVGSTAQIKKSISRGTKVIDLKGKLLIPGFNDAHIHFLSGSVGLAEVDLNNAGTIQEVVQRIKKFAKENPSRKWITGRGWQYTMFKGAYPSKETLDSAVEDRPVFIRAYDGHSAWANSFALKLVKVSKGTQFDGFGEMIRDGNGEPTGVFKEKAMGLVGDSIPALTKEEKLDALRRGLKLAASLGITSIGNASGTIDEFNLYKELLKNNELTVRVATAFSVGATTTPEEIKKYTALKDSVGRNNKLTARNVKFVLDGVIESHTAGMLEPYSNLAPKENSPSGSLSLPVEKYRSLVAEFDKSGFQVYTHAIGDRAVREALNAYELAAATNRTSSRNRIEHIETISPVDLPRFAALGVLPSMEPIHAEPGTVSVWADGVGEKRLPYSFAWASVLKAGGHLVFSSDWPACVSISPIRGLHTAVTRRTIEGEPKEGWIPRQKISITQALTAYTQGGAYSSFEESSKGKIAPGYLADIVVLSQDLFTIDPMKTFETKVLITIFDGRIIYEAEKVK